MSLIEKIKPYEVDLLVYGVFKNETWNAPKINSFPFLIQFLDQKDHYFINHNGKQIHRSKIFHKSHLLKSFDFRSPLMTIGDCVTDEAYRGRGIYTAVVSSIVELYHSHKDIYMLVSPDNMASIKGIRNAGLNAIGRIQCTKVGPLYFKKKFTEFD